MHLLVSVNIGGAKKSADTCAHCSKFNRCANFAVLPVLIALTGIYSGYLRHFFCAEFKSENIKILRNMIGIA